MQMQLNAYPEKTSSSENAYAHAIPCCGAIVIYPINSYFNIKIQIAYNSNQMNHKYALEHVHART